MNRTVKTMMSEPFINSNLVLSKSIYHLMGKRRANIRLMRHVMYYWNGAKIGIKE